MLKIAPYCCIFCGSLDGHQRQVCDICHANLPWLTCVCQRCHQPLHKDQSLCGNCLKHHAYYDQITAVFEYLEPIVGAIHALKFGGKRQVARALATLFKEQYPDILLPDILIPMPLHPKRHSQRSFNQAIEIAKPLRRLYKIPIARKWVVRIKHTKPQAQCQAKQRRENVKDAFKVIKPVQDKHIVIIDDIVTTGSTVNELAKTLKKAGARRVDVWCLSRAAR
ncbi:MAG: ComF family protein [Gammaproteobacteria bacterium]